MKGIDLNGEIFIFSLKGWKAFLCLVEGDSRISIVIFY